MADFPAEVQVAPNPAANAPVSATLAVYVLFGIAAVVGIAGHGMASARRCSRLSASPR